jgi:hypothetical protein
VPTQASATAVQRWTWELAPAPSRLSVCLLATEGENGCHGMLHQLATVRERLVRAEAAREHSESHARRLEAAAQQRSEQHEQRRRNAQADTAAAEEKVFREVQRTAELASLLEETRRELAHAEAASRRDKRCVV